jgi:nicotinate-nucleotide adenylyltransferase
VTEIGDGPAASRVGHIGILGGTFNPPHVGHLVVGQEAASQLGLDRVLIVPVNVPPHKDLESDPGGTVRLELCRAAIGDDPLFEVSPLEVQRDGPSFTVDTLRELHEHRPHDKLTFIVGADMAHGLPSWRDPERVLDLARIAVAEREGVRRDDIVQRLRGLRGASSRLDFFAMPRLDVSSSDIRRRVAQGRPIRHLVPDGVRVAIVEGNLYR